MAGLFCGADRSPDLRNHTTLDDVTSRIGLPPVCAGGTSLVAGRIRQPTRSNAYADSNTKSIAENDDCASAVSIYCYSASMHPKYANTKPLAMIEAMIESLASSAMMGWRLTSDQ